ncbi:unnamed protein product [Periconia digitata]|uniref:Ricin B lectin domain-containing protein n=1 Tax=Periconia digitata TaxID=1303443 RepID=A0A9W4UAQ8_9PLEO|nr:unnamed protein product [Periconia digitata]
MATIDFSSTYLLTNSMLGSSGILGSTLNNDTLVIEPPKSSQNQLWFVTATEDQGSYRLHTVQKGDNYALDINYETLDLRFFDVGQGQGGQKWKFDTSDDGTFKLSNNYTGPDKHLEVTRCCLKMILANGDNPGQHWGLHKVAADLSSSTTSSTNITFSTPTPRIEPSPSPNGTSNASPTPTPTTSDNSGACDVATTSCAGSTTQRGLSGGGKAGVGVGVVLGVLALVGGGYLVYRRWGGNRRPRERITMGELHYS